MQTLLVFIGGGLGAVLRHLVNMAAARWTSGAYPWGTLFINVLGAFLMGVVVEYWASHSGLSQPARLFLATGILGGFTTFSTFALEVGLLHARGESLMALGYAAGSVVLGVGALFAGMATVRAAAV